MVHKSIFSSPFDVSCMATSIGFPSDLTCFWTHSLKDNSFVVGGAGLGLGCVFVFFATGSSMASALRFGEARADLVTFGEAEADLVTFGEAEADVNMLSLACFLFLFCFFLARVRSKTYEA